MTKDEETKKPILIPRYESERCLIEYLEEHPMYYYKFADNKLMETTERMRVWL